MHDGTKAYYLTRIRRGLVVEDGKKMDAISADGLLRAIRTLTATKFVNAGFSNPAITLTVTSNDGKRVEKVGIAKAGKRLHREERE